MPRFQDIPAFRPPNYSIDVAWEMLKFTLDGYEHTYGLDWEPEFQRGYVWTPQQRTDYVEFVLLGGISGKDVFLNCPDWHTNPQGPIQIVDGKQRLAAILAFLDDQVPAFGHVRSEYTDPLDILKYRFRFHMNDLAKPADVIRWYLALNTGGTIHTPEEIARVRQLLDKQKNEQTKA